MASLNKVCIIGRLGDDPSTNITKTGMEVSNFTVATSESYTKDGQKIEQTEWHRVIVWSKLALHCATYLRKGSLVYLEGKLQTRKFTNKQGVEQYTTEIVANQVQFLTPRKELETAAVSTNSSFEPLQPKAENNSIPTGFDDLADIPF